MNDPQNNQSEKAGYLCLKCQQFFEGTTIHGHACVNAPADMVLRLKAEAEEHQTVYADDRRRKALFAEAVEYITQLRADLEQARHDRNRAGMEARKEMMTVAAASPAEGTPHEWWCAKCKEKGMPWTHVTYEETHEGCGGTCISVPIEPAPAEGSAVEWVEKFLNSPIPPDECAVYHANYDALRPLIQRYARHLETLAKRCDAAEKPGWYQACLKIAVILLPAKLKSPGIVEAVREIVEQLAAAQAESEKLRDMLNIWKDSASDTEKKLIAAQSRITALNSENNTMASLMMDETRDKAAAQSEAAALRVSWKNAEEVPRHPGREEA